MKYFASLAVAALLPFSAHASPSPQAKEAPPATQEKKLDAKKEKAIRKLLRVSKADEAGEMILDQMIQSLKRSIPSIPESFWKGLSKKEITKEFDAELVRIYDRHLTLEEIGAITEFYETTMGKAVLEKMKHISMDSALAGQDFSGVVLRMVMDEAEKKGVLPKPHGH